MLDMEKNRRNIAGVGGEGTTEIAPRRALAGAGVGNRSLVRGDPVGAPAARVAGPLKGYIVVMGPGHFDWWLLP
jgi:hypothetical protein